MNNILDVQSVSRNFGVAGAQVRALQEVTFSLSRGEFVALMGPSGCGKSTLLSILGGADAPSSGAVVLDGVSVPFASPKALVELRRTQVGFVFQQFHLLPTLTVEENVCLTALLAGMTRRDALARARALIASVNLEAKVNSFPVHLSGGEMQRVAVCRALAPRPPLVLADEPTGNLDSKSGGTVLSLLADAAKDGTTVLMATHSEEAERFTGRTLFIRDGIFTGEERRSHAEPR